MKNIFFFLFGILFCSVLLPDIFTTSSLYVDAKGSSPAGSKASTQGKVGVGGYMGRALIDLIISLTQSRIQRSNDVSEGVHSCLDEELPTSSNIWVDDKGISAKETPENYISRIILDKHPDTCGFVACLLNQSLVSSAIMKDMSGKLLFVAASLIGSTPDPAALFRGFLENGVPLTYTMGLGNNNPSGSTSISTDQFNLLHKILSRDKSMLGDIPNRLLQPANQQNSHYPLYLSAVGESLIMRLSSQDNDRNNPEENTKIRNAIKSLLSNADIKPSTNKLTFNNRNNKDNYLGRKISYTHIETLNNAMSQVLITTLINYLHNYNHTYSWSGTENHPLGKLLLQQDKYGRNPLHVAVITNNYRAIELLINEIQSLETIIIQRLQGLDLSFDPSLSTHSKSISTKFLQTIIEQQDIFGYTPYMLAFVLGQNKTAQVLLNIHQQIGSTKGITEESMHQLSSQSSTSSLLPKFLNRNYRRGKGKVLMYNEHNQLIDITNTTKYTVDSSEQSLLALTTTDSTTNGGWKEPISVPHRFLEAVEASKQTLLHNITKTTDEIHSMYNCDIDIMDFTCSYATDKENCLQKVSLNQTLFAQDILRDYYIPNRPVLLRGLAKYWPIRSLWDYQHFLLRHGKHQITSVDIPYAPVFGKKSSDTVTVLQHIQAFQKCTPSMLRGEEKFPYGLSAEICSMYVDNGEQISNEEEDSNNIIAPTDENGNIKSTNNKPKKIIPKPYVFHRLTPGEAFSVSLIDDMTLVPWFLNTKLPRWDYLVNNSVNIQPDGSVDTVSSSSSSLPLESLMMALPQPPSPQFYLGGPGSGAPPHYHEDAWNVLAYGKKAWYIVPPSAAEYMTVPIHEYILEVLPKTKDKLVSTTNKNITTSSTSSFWGPNSRPLTCIQEAGDVIYVPHGWGHGVLNLETVIGYAVEFHSPFQRY